jgi:hypothetical protein
MRVAHWTTILVISVTLSLGPYSVFAAPILQDELPLDITIITAQTEVIVGAPMTWRVTLLPLEGQSIGPIELQPGDTRSWVWLDGIQTIEALTHTLVLNVLAVPLTSGQLTPILEARHRLGKETQTQLVIAEASVNVEPAETRVEASLIALQGTARKNIALPVELSIHNRSPFTLIQVQVQGNGADLTWDTPVVLRDIQPNNVVHQVLAPTVEGQHPQPQLRIDYTWIDTVGASHTHTLYVSGEAVVLKETIPKEFWALLIAVLSGSLVALIPGGIIGWLSRRRQKGVNRTHVRGLLRLMTLQSEHAADNGVTVKLEPLETIFKEEGLFSIVEEDKLAKYARDLWKAAERHNTGLSQPGGVQRSEDLRNAAAELRKKLDGARKQATE